MPGLAWVKKLSSFSSKLGPVAITGIMYVPKLSVNLLSQTQLMLMGMCFMNNRKQIVVVDDHEKLEVQPMVRIQASTVLPSPLQCLSPLPLRRKLDGTDLTSHWHCCLGHLS